jgi:hypothetical protein
MHKLAQGEPRHHRAAPWQRVHHGDCLRRSHIDRRGDAATKRMLRENEGGRGALEQKREGRERWALSVEVKNSLSCLHGSRAPRIACSTRIKLQVMASVTNEQGPP